MPSYNLTPDRELIRVVDQQPLLINVGQIVLRFLQHGISEDYETQISYWKKILEIEGKNLAEAPTKDLRQVVRRRMDILKSIASKLVKPPSVDEAPPAPKGFYPSYTFLTKPEVKKVKKTTVTQDTRFMQNYKPREAIEALKTPLKPKKSTIKMLGDTPKFIFKHQIPDDEQLLMALVDNNFEQIMDEDLKLLMAFIHKDLGHNNSPLLSSYL